MKSSSRKDQEVLCMYHIGNGSQLIHICAPCMGLNGRFGATLEPLRVHVEDGTFAMEVADGRVPPGGWSAII